MEIINYGPEISILVVDDDQIYLSILSTILRKLNHHVVAMKNPVDALDALRRKEKSFDLIITDVHMPEMSGLELLKHVGEEFKLPVVLMSADTDKDIMLKGLNDGAMFYLTKPISSQKLTRIWQFVNPPIDESPTSNPLPSIQTTSLIPSATNFMRIQDQPEKMDVNNNNNINVNVFTLLPLNNGKHKENTPPLIFSSNVARKRANKDAARKKSASVSKKPRLVWTTSLHNIFLEAVKKVGLDKAVPKKILELMNVPGLKRVNVASHLQKYRIFLQRIEEATSSMQFGVPFDWNERPFRSSFVLNEITYLSQRFNQQTEDYIEPSEERMIVANMFGKGQGSNQVNNFLENHHPNVDTSLAVSDHIQVIKPSEGAQTLNQNVPKELPSIGGYFQGSSSGFSFEQQRNPQFDDDGVFNNINQPTFNNNYAGLRIGANGELVSTINNSTTAIHNDNDNIDNMGKAIHGHGYFTENCVADGHQVVNNEVNHAYNLTSIDYNNATPLADHFLATNDEVNSYIDMPTDVEHNATHQQQNDFGSSQEMPNLDSIGDELRQLGIEFHDQETCCYDFDFGSNDVQCDDQGGLFEGLLDQVITSDDDIPFDCFLSQEYGQGFNQQDGRIDFSKPN